jgi:hypothetical protein
MWRRRGPAILAEYLFRDLDYIEKLLATTEREFETAEEMQSSRIGATKETNVLAPFIALIREVS